MAALWIVLACGSERSAPAPGATPALPGEGEGEGAAAEGEGEGEVGEGEGPPPECRSHADCDDGVFCNGAEGCSEGRCFASPRVPCVDRVDCTVDLCDEDSDQCTFRPDEGACAPDQVCDTKAGCIRAGECLAHENCDDGLLCNGQESCVGGQCVAGEPMDCQDDLVCTVESCVEELGLCQSVPDHTLCLPTEFCNSDEGCVPRPPCDHDDDCDDAFFCNGVEFCDPEVERCSAGGAPEVRDDMPCTIDVCSEAQALVLHVPNNARCSDAEFCNGAEVCHPLEGCVPGVPPALSDGVGCTLDTCDEALDFIDHAPDHEACEDGLFCNGAERCHPIDDCVLGEPVDVNDGVGCTIDSCDEVGDRVVHVASAALCDDDQFCNGAETCDAVLDCQAGVPPDLEDDQACTEGVCDEVDDVVTQRPVHARCDNQTFCDGVERCDPDRGCVDGPDPDLSDGVDCTEDVCDEAGDRALHLARDVRCDNQRWCDGAEVCDVQRGCQDGPDPDLSDGLDCTDDACDEGADRATHTPVHARCLDADLCDGVERCDVVQGCVDAPAPADDGLVCEDDPRSICGGGQCAESVCGDRIVDGGAGEECDDGGRQAGDGCGPNCLAEGVEPGAWEGDFDGDPALDLSLCGGILTLRIDDWAMSTQGEILRLLGRPGYPDGIGGGGGFSPVEFTGPIPAGVDFTVTKRYEGMGICTEEYTVVGSFVDADHWTGTLSADFIGELCGVVNCENQQRQVGGARR